MLTRNLFGIEFALWQLDRRRCNHSALDMTPIIEVGEDG